MPLRWRKRPQWPPSPSVEDEIESLSKELHGFSFLGELPGIEGVHARGDIDQHPVILDVLIVSHFSSYVGEKQSHGSPLSDVSAGPPTPTMDIKQDPFFQFLGEPLVQEPLKNPPLRTPYNAQDAVPPPQPPRRVSQKTAPSRNSSTGPRQRSAPRETEPPVRKPGPLVETLPPKRQPKATATEGSQSTAAPTRAPTAAPAPTPVPAPIRPNLPEQRKPASSAIPKRSESVQHRRSAKNLVINPTSASGYLSDSATIHRKQHGKTAGQTSTDREAKKPPLSPGLLSPGLSVAERLEEKLRRRREQRVSGTPPQSTQPENHTLPLPAKPEAASPPEERSVEVPGAFPDFVDPELPVPPPAPVPAPPHATVPPPSDPSGPASDGEAPFTTTSDASQTTKPAPPPKSALRSVSLDRAQPTPPHPSRRRTVSFAEKPLEPPPPPPLQVVKQETSLASVAQLQPPQQDGSPSTSRSASPSTSFGLLPCPRAIPVAGYQDWHTIQGLTHLEICPSCIKQMRKSRFRDRFILSTPRPRVEKIRCSMSEPWARLAWAQTLKKKLDHLDLLIQITRPPPGLIPCTGRIISDQYWNRIVDPDTDTFLPQFNVCSACVRNVRILMPAHRETFHRSRGMHERVCDFVTDSPRFIRYIDALDYAANRAEEESAPADLGEFLAYARRKVVLRDCRRSRLILNTWHYMPQLPEFTVCEDCYDDVVWPLAKSRFPIAREFSTVMRVLPGDGPSSCREASCKLYSPRIRGKFNEAVRRNDMPYLQWIALKRYEAEQRFWNRQEELLEDEHRGYDCSVELRKNLEEWKRWE